jgi:Uncharacterized Fe-S protein
MLKKELLNHGLKVSQTTVDHVYELKEDIENLRKQNLISEKFFKENLEWMSFNYRDTMKDARSILVIAYPQYMTRLNFIYNDKRYIVPVPPTYIYSKADSILEDILNRVLVPYKFSYKRASLPVKLLAVRTGLGMYGRNNICYINGYGSFHRLYAFYTDMPCAEGSWGDKKVMPECTECSACINACPSGCINNERFLIHAGRCITNLNEKEEDFPQWLSKSWHNSIVGCMRCQAACPQNREFTGKAENEVTFDKDETKLILEKVPFDILPDILKQKLDNLNLTEYYNVLGRNLSAIIE